MPVFVSFMSGASVQNYLLVSNLLHFVFCIFVVSYLYIHLNNQNNSHSRVVFKHSILVILLSLLADMLSYVFDTRTFFGAAVLNHTVMFFSIISTTVVGAMWNVFFDAVFHLRVNGRKRMALYLTPTVVTFVCLVVNFFNGWFYYIDGQNVYHRGPAYFVDFILQYGIFLVLVIRALIYRGDTNHPKTLKQRKLRNSIVWLGAATAFFGLLQALTGGFLALHCFGITVGVMIMFLRFQDDQIVYDVLTGLNNRYSLDTYMVEKMKTYADGQRANRDLYLLRMDINDFKRINDKHGHIEGDAALKRVSNSLKSVGARYAQGLFLARYGGDEFSAVFECSSEHAVKELCMQIKEAVKEGTEDLNYRLTVGVGYAKYTGKAMSMSVLYELADNAMYIDKNKNSL